VLTLVLGRRAHAYRAKTRSHTVSKHRRCMLVTHGRLVGTSSAGRTAAILLALLPLRPRATRGVAGA